VIFGIDMGMAGTGSSRRRTSNQPRPPDSNINYQLWEELDASMLNFRTFEPSFQAKLNHFSRDAGARILGSVAAFRYMGERWARSLSMDQQHV
jgi:hypothetical protein